MSSLAAKRLTHEKNETTVPVLPALPVRPER